MYAWKRRHEGETVGMPDGNRYSWIKEPSHSTAFGKPVSIPLDGRLLVMNRRFNATPSQVITAVEIGCPLGDQQHRQPIALILALSQSSEQEARVRRLWADMSHSARRDVCQSFSPASFLSRAQPAPRCNCDTAMATGSTRANEPLTGRMKRLQRNIPGPVSIAEIRRGPLLPPA